MKRIFFLLLSMVLLLQSCIKESIPSCNSELLLRFRYTLNNQYTNLFGQEVGAITVYLFDSNGNYVDRFSASGNPFTNEYVMHIAVPEGKYNAVVLGGDITTYTVGEVNHSTGTLSPELRKGATHLNDFRIELKNQTSTDNYRLPIDLPNDLYTGWTPAAVSSANNEITDVELMKYTKKIKVKINGTDSSSEPLEVYITAANGRYRHDNSIDSDLGVFKYAPANTVTSPNYQESNLRSMRLVTDQSPLLIIRNKTTSQVLYNENIINLILATGKYATQEDLDREDEFIFEITLTNGVVTTLTINGWSIHNITTDTL